MDDSISRLVIDAPRRALRERGHAGPTVRRAADGDAGRRLAAADAPEVVA